MTKEDFISIIKEPGDISDTEINALKGLVETYPYFHLGRMLFLKALHASGNLGYEENLGVTALSVPDRKMLYKTILRTGLRDKLKAAIIEDSGEITEEQEELISEEIDALETDFLKEILMNTPAYDITKVFAEDNTKEETEVKETKKPAEITESFNLSEMSFYDWLDEDKVPVSKDEKKSTDEIIDTFIKTQPRIKSRASDTYVPTDISRMSLSDNSDFVTETLARIYIKQKNYDKAIEIYEKLSLTNPEKKGYFATQIHYLKDLDSKS